MSYTHDNVLKNQQNITASEYIGFNTTICTAVNLLLYVTMVTMKTNKGLLPFRRIFSLKRTCRKEQSRRSVLALPIQEVVESRSPTSGSPL